MLYSPLLDKMRTMFFKEENTEEMIEGKALSCVYDSGLFIHINVSIDKNMKSSYNHPFIALI